ncbi:MAG: hypothetical protein M3373_06290 [Gemmatimonadota bacterium]|nr:hypothetical protein [Gemmatimonadota bacterium]
MLQVAERVAVARQYDVIVSFDLARGMLRVVEDRDNDGVVDASERVTWRALEDEAQFATPPAGIGGTVGAPVTGGNVSTINGMPSVIFRRNGAASTDLEIYMNAGRPRLSDFRGISVVQSTGRTEWFRYLNSQWKGAGL